MIDKKVKRLFLKYMENKSSLNSEEVEYLKEKDLLREDIPVMKRNLLLILKKYLQKYL